MRAISYRSQFIRDKASPPSHQFTGRDFEILASVNRHRFLSTDQLAAIHCHGETNRPRLRRRLHKLFHHGFLHRPRVPIGCAHVYTITGSGLRRLADYQPGVTIRRVKPAVASSQLPHQLGLSDFTVSVELSVRQDPTLSIIDEDELFAGASEAIRKRRGWPVEITLPGQELTAWVKPDRLFAIEFADRPRGRNRRYFAVEYDSGSMPVTRSDLRQSSCARKFLVYAQTIEQGILDRYFGIEHVYVLFVTSSHERAEGMRQAAAQAAIGTRARQALFFGVRPAAPMPATAPDVLRTGWQTVRGRGETLPL